MARGPAPSYQPSFTPEQLQQARRVVASHHAPYIKVQRARMTLALQQNPQASNATLCALTGAHRSTVQRWRKRWAQTGFALDDAPRCGRPPSFSPAADRADQGGRL